jgi:hypothetical protein
LKRIHLLIGFLLTISSFIYLFYRTEKTIISQLFISAVSYHHYAWIKNYISSHVLLNDLIVYSVPEGFWVLCITLTSKNLLIRIGDRQLNCLFVPLILAIGLEGLQWANFTNGQFDYWDLGAALFFWVLGVYAIRYQPSDQPIFKPFNFRSMACLTSYAIVYLAHVS